MKRCIIYCSLSFSLLLAACGDDAGRVCDPGIPEPCTCPDGPDSIQVCLDDGSGWGACRCDCTPDCTGKECGDDGCGGNCAPGCGAGEACVGGQCEACTPDCANRECGNDGCGGSCAPGCGAGEACFGGQCEACTPDCVGQECGDDGCGGTCAPGCEAGEACVGGQCEACTPDCAGQECGDDGCGGTCAPGCGAGEACVGGQCEPECTPDCTGQECGDDGCGGNCAPGCAAGESCVGGQCQGCTPDCTGRCCGSDGCGGTCPDTCADPSGFCDVSTCTCTSVCDYQFSPTTSFRRLDTRSGEKLQAGSEHSFVMAGRDGIPDNAQAVAVRFTVVAPEAAGFITAYDTGAPTPDTSVLNYAPSQTTGNTFLVKLGTQKKITVFTLAATHLIIDVFGYSVGHEAFHAQTPYRLVDTRGGTTPAAGSTTCLTVAGVNGVSTDAKAVAVVVTAVLPAADGSMVAFASGEAVPPTRSLSYAANQVTANESIVPIGADQQICVHTTARSDFILDVTGFFESNAAYQSLTPYRKLDVSHGSDSTNCYQLAGVDGIPADAQAVAFNLTAVAPPEAGFVTVHPNGTQRPVSSNLNYAVGGSTTNGVISKVGDNGEVCFYLRHASRLLVDVVGYWPGMDSCCAGQTCDSPPFIGCSGTTELITYTPSGSCMRGTCDYGHAVTACGYLCQQDSCIAAPDYPYHDRTEWQDPAYPVSSSGWMDLNALQYITLHYIGVDGVDLSDIPEVLRRDQHDYVTNRGYSLGYNSAVSPDGHEWEIRGFDYRCAANGNQAVNRPSYAIQLMLPNTWSAPPQAQIEGVRNLVAKIRATAAAAGNTDFLEINGHRDIWATACPGDVIHPMIQNGTFEP